MKKSSFISYMVPQIASCAFYTFNDFTKSSRKYFVLFIPIKLLHNNILFIFTSFVIRIPLVFYHKTAKN